MPISESKLSVNPREKLREVVCSKLQDKCFDIVDEFLTDSIFIRRIRSETVEHLCLSQVAFKKIGTREFIEKTKPKTLYIRGMIQIAFELGTFKGLKDFEKGNVLQIGLGGGSLNALFASRFPHTKLTSVEIDPTMKYIAKKWFLVEENDKQQIIIDDGIKFIKNNDQKFDLIALDACFDGNFTSLVCPGSEFLDPLVIKAFSNSLAPNGTFTVNIVYYQPPTLNSHKNLVSEFSSHFRQCITQRAGGNFVLGCSNRDSPKFTLEFMERARKKLRFGRKLALKCDKAGMQVLAACLTSEGLNSLKKESKNITAFQMNVTSEESIRDSRPIVEKVAGKFGGLHGIVNNAGITGNSFWGDFLTPDDYQTVFDVNVMGIIRVTQAFMDLVKQSKGRIVNTASICGRVALPNLGPYTISKYGVEAYSDTLRVEQKVFGITVSIIEPGFFKTPLTEPKRIVSIAEKIWNRASEETRKEYGHDLFEKAKEIMVKHLDTRSSSNTDLVVDAYFHALTSVRPKTRYHVGLDAKLFYIPLSFLPARITDVIYTLGRVLERFPKPAAVRGK
ncbi:hypothetical protein FO519_003725 [Halicephalobus sp. NKZ332]|nr:hypothetical protein FO519_003725 [Halicephalobus sp. NKZ332]